MNIEKIKQLNDAFRKSFSGGKVLLTCGIASLPLVQQNEVINKVKKFNDFTEDNNPYGEHDFGCFDYR